MPAKRTKSTPNPARAPSFSPPAEKDEEELELEAVLFGKKRKRVGAPAVGGKGKGRLVVPVEEEESDEEMAGLEDHELFQIDEPIHHPASSVASGSGSRAGTSASDNSDSDSDNSSASDDDEPSQPAPSSSVFKSKSTSKKPLWSDPADERLSVNLADDKRLRKLARGKEGDEAVVGGKELQQKLRGQFEKMHPKPTWASRKTNPATTSSPTDHIQPLLASTLPFLATTTRRGLLARGALDIDRLRDANYQSKAPGKEDGGVGITGLRWHGGLNVLAAVGGDRRLRMFSIDGVTNPSITTIHLPSLPITSTLFHPSGTALLLSGPRPYYYTYDLTTQRCLRSPLALFGNTSTSTSSTSPKDLSKTAFSPDGSVLAIAGRRGEISLIAWAPGGAGELVVTLKSGRAGGVKDMCFMGDGSELWVLGEGSEVDCWDLGERRIVGRWRDEGGFGGSLMERSTDGEFTAVGSSTGVVNVYSTPSITTSVTSSLADGMMHTAAPKPIRGLMNLTTAATTIAFNHDSQMMLTASNKKKDAFKMYHLPSATAFTNWPTSSTPLGVVTAAEFSSASEYVAIGNARGKVLLYSVKHYKN